ncbi:MAG TPA: hypothetical protein VEL28_17410 [Candidatus Binatia bacterium]|nr:hypothetical protein [Candidatus Binatia bacterium]
MRKHLRNLAAGSVAFALLVLLPGCNGGDHPAPHFVRLFFGTTATGTCSSLTIEVDLEAANAFLARDLGSNPDCSLVEALENSGCEIDIVIEGDIFRATISGCAIPAFVSAFECFFVSADLSQINAAATAQCTCASANCDDTPAVCISDEPGAGTCEDCDNGVDDDNDGDVDCQDTQCADTPSCGITSTTDTTTTTDASSSTTTTTSTTTTVGTPTTTTIGGPTTTLVGETVSIRFQLTSASSEEVGAVQFRVDYSDAPGQFEGTGSQVSCEEEVDGAIFAATDDDAGESLSLGIISLDGFAAPTPLVTCQFTASEIPDPSDFDITIEDASDPDLNPITVTIEVQIGV